VSQVIRWFLSFLWRGDVSVNWMIDYRRREGSRGIDQGCIRWDLMKKRHTQEPQEREA
jgi:hypothetical protein